MASFDVHDDAMRPHVMAPDFLDVERYPELIFRSTEIRVNGSGVTVAGGWLSRGDSSHRSDREPHRPIVDPYGNDRVAMALETVIDRTKSAWSMRSACRTARPRSVTR